VGTFADAFLGTWIIIWIVVWIVFYGLLRIGNKALLFAGSSVVMIAASWLFLRLNSHGWESNRSLAIGIGGGMGLFLLLNVWESSGEQTRKSCAGWRQRVAAEPRCRMTLSC
jgi:hypothetical protein